MSTKAPVKRHFLNGQWVDESELHISPLDLAVLRGFGVFDFMTATNGHAFHLGDHLDRYERSAAQLQLELPMSRAELERVIENGIKRNADIEDLFIRLILTGGESPDFISPGTPNFMILFHPAQRPNAQLYTDGVKVITYPYSRELAEAKSLNYAAAVLAMKQAVSEDAVEALYVDPETDSILEGTGSNVFFAKNGELFTPSEHILKGVMRRTVIDLATSDGIKVHELAISRAMVADFDECFITSAVKRLLPVSQIGPHIVYGPAGPVTKRLQQLFNDHAGITKPSNSQRVI